MAETERKGGGLTLLVLLAFLLFGVYWLTRPAKTTTQPQQPPPEEQPPEQPPPYVPTYEFTLDSSEVVVS